ncbi:MAG TPA: hypothetical protein VLF59_05135 [Candidatus Saccharimonadales bacterium]|nr:hypothetical protein [Candidatus Saccharimonadales bacterium]
MAHINGSTAEIDGVTEDPRRDVSRHEPIDVIDGNMVAWDEQANLYHFTSQSLAGETSVGGIGTMLIQVRGEATILSLSLFRKMTLKDCE